MIRIFLNVSDVNATLKTVYPEINRCKQKNSHLNYLSVYVCAKPAKFLSLYLENE